MIGYPVKRRDLEDLIAQQSATWLGRAETKTEEFRNQGFYQESSSIWSEVKVVYMRLQGNCKCAYCERKLESESYGKVEQDVEHFRPKGNVRKWKLPKSLKDSGITLTDVPDEGGYYLLPYHIFNYAAACKPCNSTLKKDYFPISGAYDLQGKDPAMMVSEQPLLIYPIGDDDPESLIRFYGVSPQAVKSRGYDRHRALTTIEFFKLDDGEKRKNLYRERAIVIVAMYPYLRQIKGDSSKEDKRQAQDLIDGFTHSTSSHANCARSFRDLFYENSDEADEIFGAALKLVTSIS